jgi:hypothetical protein
LYYSITGTAISESQRFSQRFSLDPNSPTTMTQLSLYVSKYYVNGTFIGFEPLQPSFFLCPTMTLNELNSFMYFGGNTAHACRFNLSYAMNNYNTIFYELFIKDGNGKLYDVPIRVKNLITCITMSFNYYLNSFTGLSKYGQFKFSKFRLCQKILYPGCDKHLRRSLEYERCIHPICK